MGEGAITTGVLTMGEGDLDFGLRDLVRLLLLDFERLRFGLRDRDRRGGVGDRLVYLRLGGEGLFSTTICIGDGLRDFSRTPALICSSFSFLAAFFAL